MKIAIAVHTVDANASEPAEPSEQDQCFAEFEVGDETRSTDEEADDEDVQVTVVLRGKRGELEDPARGMTELVLRALEERRRSASRDVIDVAGVAVEVAQAAG